MPEPPTFVPGARVRSHAPIGRVGVLLKTEGRFATVFWAGGLEEVVDVGSLVPEASTPCVGAPADLALSLTHARLEHPLTDQLLSYRASRTRFLPHQFIPVRRLVANPSRRLLIADEVGTGKTIEAGLIWAELEARSPGGLESVLVVCPKALVAKWQDEFLHRFDLRLEAFGSSEWRGALVTAQRDGCLSPRFSHGVVGLELARREELVALLGETECTWDLVVVDEAHEMRNPATLSNAFGQLLAERAAALLLLTATPAQTSLEDLRALLLILGVDLARDRSLFEREIKRDAALNETARLVRRLPPGWRVALSRALEGMRTTERPGEGTFERLNACLPPDDPTPAERVAYLSAVSESQSFSPFMTRTLRGGAALPRPVRQAGVRRVPFSPSQEEFYEAVYEMVLERADLQGVPAGFACQMVERRTASCAPAVAREILGIEKAIEDDPELQTSFSLTEAQMLSPLARSVVEEEDPKATSLLSVLREMAGEGIERVLVFSTFRGTLTYLEEQLRNAGLRVAQIHGGVPHFDLECRPGELSREAIAGRFRRGLYDVLLGSEVIGQGLDFEHCSALINYDLPWNPMRVEQRIGRIDRLGQQATKVMIMNMSTPGTIESRILERLYMRLQIFEHALGEFETVLGEELETFSQGIFSARLSPAQQEERLDRIARAAEGSRRQATLVAEEQGSLLSSMQRVETELVGFQQLERALLSQAEIQRFVVSTFQRCYGDRAGRNREDGLVELDLSRAGDDLRNLSRALPIRSSARERTRKLIARASGQKSKLLLTFQGVDYQEGVEFAHVRHPLVLLCRHLWRTRGEGTTLATGVIRTNVGLQPGVYSSGWAIAGFEGLVSRVELVETLLDSDGNEAVLPEGISARDLLDRAEPRAAMPPGVDAAAARSALERRLLERAAAGKATIAARNEVLAEKARAATESAAAARRSWLKARLEDPGLNVNLRRMYTSWHARLGQELERQLAELAGRSALEFRCQYLGSFIFEIL